VDRYRIVNNSDVSAEWPFE